MLSDHQRLVIELSYGLNGLNETPKEGIALILGVGDRRVRQLHTEALNALKAHYGTRTIQNDARAEGQSGSTTKQTTSERYPGR